MSHVAMNRITFFALFIGLGGAAQYIRARVRQRSIKRLMVARGERSEKEFTGLFPTECAEIALKVRNCIEQHIGCPLKGILPQDRLSKELGLRDADRATVMKIIMNLEEIFDIDLPAVDKCMSLSIGEIVRIIYSKKG